MKDYRNRLKAIAGDENREWFRIQNKANDTTRIDIYDEIGFWGISAKDFVNELNDIESGSIDLHINSPGGVVWDGYAIYNALKNHKAVVNVSIDGVAASAASFIACAGDTVTMNAASDLMIHDAMGLAIGNASEMQEMADQLDKMSDKIAQIYADRSGGDVADWRALMEDETWFTAEEALDAGLVDKVSKNKRKSEESEKAKAQFDYSVFNHAGRADAPEPKFVNSISTLHQEQQNEIPTVDSNATEVSMTPDQLEKLGLPSDATEEQINEKLEALTAEPEKTDETQTQETATTATETATGEGETGTTAEGASNSFKTPDGMTLVDSEQFAAITSAAAKVEAFAKAQSAAECESFLNSAMDKGQVGPTLKAKLATQWADGGAEQVKAIVNELPEQKFPTTEIGHAGTPTDATNVANDTSYPTAFLTPSELQAIAAHSKTEA